MCINGAFNQAYTTQYKLNESHEKLKYDGIACIKNIKNETYFRV